MIQGQLYRVSLTGRSGTELTTVVFITVGNNPSDLLAKVPYLYDLSDFDSYRVDYVEKCQGRIHVVSSKVSFAADDKADAIIKRHEGTQGIWQKTGQTTDSRKWLVNAVTTCFAKDEKHALKKLKERIDGGSERVVTVAEEVPCTSGLAVAKDVSIFDRATFVRG